ncbi:MAG: phosphotransferase [Anaerolineaceae bacterium]|nr:phosphotransferase [Anaerolineaceae bacterium]
MAQKPTLPTENTVQFLQEKFNGGVTDLTLLSGGDWSQAYSFVHQQKKYVLRWCHSSETFEKDAAASLLSNEAMPVPKVIEAGRQFDTYFAITEFAYGKFIDKLNAAEVQNLLPALFDLFDALRNADLSNTTGYGGWDKNGTGYRKSWKDHLLGVNGPDDNPERFTYGWYAKLAKSPIGTKPFDDLYPKFESLVEKCPEVRQLIHSDLLNYNLLTLDNHISGVIDWQCSLYGDSLYDVAWFTFYEPWYPEFGAIQLSQKLRAHFEASADSTNLKERLVCYQLHIALDSIIYNSAKENWKNAQEVVDYVHTVLSQLNNL